MLSPNFRVVFALATVLSCLVMAGCNDPGAERPLPENPSAGDEAAADETANKETGQADETEEKEPADAGTKAASIKVEYLEIVTPEVDALCQQYAKAHGVTFSEPNPGFGGARTAALSDGGRIGIRGPLRPDETPVVRPYTLVTDIKAAVAAAEAAGAQVAMNPMEIPGEGMFAIVINGGIECGFWQN
ncbi:MAG: hypothetical protein NXI04_25555 [Planctomycetaceae bacterium]|nr:hypothetical protein [Planctomycetaceae bacterium]